MSGTRTSARSEAPSAHNGARTRGEDRAPGGTIDLADLAIRHIERVTTSEASQTWPCPGCGVRRPLHNSYGLLVRNRAGRPLERRIRLCATCAGTVLGAADDGDGKAQHADSEPWLDTLAETGVESALRRLDNASAPTARGA